MRASSVFLVALVGLGCSMPEDKREIAALKNQVKELRQKFESIEIQEKCAKLAEHSFNTMPKTPGTSYDYTCHFNKSKNKFFINITTFEYKSMISTKTIIDFLENKPIATYCWKPDKVKKYWEVKPFYCEVNGEHKDWTTPEYEAFENSCMTD